jgi:hypothetical protein
MMKNCIFKTKIDLVNLQRQFRIICPDALFRFKVMRKKSRCTVRIPNPHLLT